MQNQTINNNDTTESLDASNSSAVELQSSVYLEVDGPDSLDFDTSCSAESREIENLVGRHVVEFGSAATSVVQNAIAKMYVHVSQGKKHQVQPLKRKRSKEEEHQLQQVFGKSAKLNESEEQRRGINAEAVSDMKMWLYNNFAEPYPSDAEKAAFVSLHKCLNLTKVNNWFINARRRIVQPINDLCGGNFNSFLSNSTTLNDLFVQYQIDLNLYPAISIEVMKSAVLLPPTQGYNQDLSPLDFESHNVLQVDSLGACQQHSSSASFSEDKYIPCCKEVVAR